MKPATRNFILTFLVLCAIGVAINFMPVVHTSVTPASTESAVPEGSE